MSTPKPTTLDKDGWVTIKPKRDKNRRRQAQQPSATVLAHDDPSGPPSTTPTSSVSLEQLTERFTKLHVSFKNTTCCSTLRDAVSSRIAAAPGTEYTAVVCLALGSLSEARTRVAPLYQLSALLVILDTLGILGGGVLAYDPVFTDVDKEFLKGYGIQPVSEEDIKQKTGGGRGGGKEEDLFLFLPHGSLALSYEYMRKTRPRLYVGNDFGIYSLRITDKERQEKFPQLEIFEQEYLRLEFPESETFYDGSVFNDLAIYWRR